MRIETMHEGAGNIFGTYDEIIQFSQIFFGAYALFACYLLFRRFNGGLAEVGSKRFEWTMLSLAMWCFTGLCIDVWAHKHLNLEETFFTPWHAVWYSGFAAYSSYIVFVLWGLNDGGIPKSISAVKEFFSSMPKGYSVGVVGMILFIVSGFGDMLWHTFLGIEGGTDILLSPTHLGLAGGLILSLLVPVMAAWHQPERVKTLGDQLPVIVGLSGAWGVITVFTSYSHHLSLPYNQMCEGCGNAVNSGLQTGIVAVLLQAIILSGFIHYFMKKFKPVPGTFTTMFLVHTIVIIACAPGKLGEAWKHALTPILSGIALDILYALFSNRNRIFAFIIGAIPVSIWLVTIATIGGKGLDLMGWSVHATAGVIFIAGSGALLISFLTDEVSSNQLETE